MYDIYIYNNIVYIYIHIHICVCIIYNIIYIIKMHGTSYIAASVSQNSSLII